MRPLSPCCRSTRRSSKRYQKREIAPPSLQGFLSFFVRTKIWELPLWRGFCLVTGLTPKDLDTWTQLDIFETTEKCLFLASRIYLFLGYGAIFPNKSGAVATHAFFVSKMVTRIDLNGSEGHQWHHVSRLQRYRQGLRWGG